MSVLKQQAKTRQHLIFPITVLAPDTEKQHTVHVFLDSGSDTNFIDSQAASSLGLQCVDLDNPLRVRGFGGSNTSCKKSTNVTAKNVLSHGSLTFPCYVYDNLPRMPTIAIPRVDTQFLRDAQKSFYNYHGEPVVPDILIGLGHFFSLLRNITALPSGLFFVEMSIGNGITGVVDQSNPDEIDRTARQFHVANNFSALDERSSFLKQLHEASLEPGNNQDQLDKLLCRFFSLESVGIHDKMDSKAEEEVNRLVFHQTLDTARIIDGRLHVRFPFKEDGLVGMESGYKTAFQRLTKQYLTYHNPAAHSPDDWLLYHEYFQDQLRRGVIEEVPPQFQDLSVGKYFPHQGVLKVDSRTTKLRVVLDASAKTRGGKSLNDAIHAGPNLTPEMVGILIRSRLYQHLMISDVEKAFHQIGLQEDHRQYTKFLWVRDPAKPPKGDNLIQYWYTKVPFGVNASPFLLMASFRYFLKALSPEIEELIRRNTYVDNIVFGCDDIQTLTQSYRILKDLFSKMSMNIREFCSNQPDVVQSLPEEDRAQVEKSKVLGVRWNTTSDTYTIQIQNYQPKKFSKKELFSIAGKTFDPLGLLSPLTVRLKMFLQKIWLLPDFDWNSIVPEVLQEEFVFIMNQISTHEFCIPRVMTSLSNDAERDLILFTDASEDNMCMTVYIRTSTRNSVSCHLITSRTKAKSIKDSHTIPRLELTAMQLGMHLIQYVISEMPANIIRQVHAFCDSQIALNWLLGGKQLRPYVENRVNRIKRITHEILDLQIPTSWSYVRTDSNPADFGTRGKKASDLLDSIWWTGPKWITSDQTDWPKEEISLRRIPVETSNEFTSELRAAVCEPVSPEPDSTDPAVTSLIPWYCTFSYQKLARIVINITLFLKKLYNAVPAKRDTSHLSMCFQALQRIHQDQSSNDPEFSVSSNPETFTVGESDLVDTILLLEAQRGMMDDQGNLRQDGKKFSEKDSYGIVRIPNRMQYSPIAKYRVGAAPVPRNHPVISIFARKIHEQELHLNEVATEQLLRCQVSSKGLRQIVRKVIQQCPKCRLLAATPYRTPVYPNFPRERFDDTRPFCNIGMDFCGPFTVTDEQDNQTKCYILLITCLYTRAVHLDVCRSRSAEDFQTAFSIFCSRYTTPRTVYCDNEKSFVNSSRTGIPSQTLDGVPVVTSWKFIPAHAPWAGGIYERLVEPTKHAIKATLGKLSPSFNQLRAIVARTELSINSRPVCILSEDQVITPLQLIMPRIKLPPSSTSGPTSSSPTSSSSVAGLPEKDGIAEEISVQQDIPEVGSFFRETVQLSEALWDSWQKLYLAKLAVIQPETLKNHGRARNMIPAVGDVILLYPITSPTKDKTRWDIGVVSKTPTDDDGYIRTVVARVFKPRKNQTKSDSVKFVTIPICYAYPLEIPSRMPNHSIAGATSPDSMPENPQEPVPDVVEVQALPKVQASSSQPQKRTNPPRLAKAKQLVYRH